MKVSNRTGSLNLMNCLRGALQAHYGDKPVALGGVFLVETGKAKIHVMVRLTHLILTYFALFLALLITGS